LKENKLIDSDVIYYLVIFKLENRFVFWKLYDIRIFSVIVINQLNYTISSFATYCINFDSYEGWDRHYH